MEQWEINKPLGECFGSGRKIEYGEEKRLFGTKQTFTFVRNKEPKAGPEEG